MRFARPFTRQALRRGLVAVALSALVSGALDLPVLAQGVDVVTDPDAPAFSAEDQAAVNALAAQLAGATSRNAVVSILQNSTLPKAQVRAAVQAATLTRSSQMLTASSVYEPQSSYAGLSITPDNLDAVRKAIEREGDTVALLSFRRHEADIKALLRTRASLVRALEQARDAGDPARMAVEQNKIEMADARLSAKLDDIRVMLGIDNGARQGAQEPASDPVGDTLYTVLKLIDASTGGSDTRLTFVDTQNNSTRNTSTAAITQPSVASTLAQNATVTIYVG